MIDTLTLLDNAAEVAYYLGKHPEICERLLDWNKPEVNRGWIMTAVESIGATTKSSSKSTR